MTKTVDLLQEQFRHLRMTETAKELPKLLRNAEKQTWTYQEFLEEILGYELKRREQKNVEKRMKWAKFPYRRFWIDYFIE